MRTRDERININQEFEELWQDLSTEEITAMIKKNIPEETVEFFMGNAHRFIGGVDLPEKAKQQLANCMVAGYILRILDERIN